MTSHSTKLAELAAPTRGRVKYAPLTAGLLARKGEAMPATPYFAAEALDLYTSGPIAVDRHEPAPASHRDAHPVERETVSLQRRPGAMGEHHSPTPSRGPALWRMRRPVMPHDLPHDGRAEPVRIDKLEAVPSDQDQAQPKQPAAEASGQMISDSAMRIAVSLDIDLNLMARLALHARHTERLPARIVEEALKSHLAIAGDVCPTCARSLPESTP